MNQFIWGLFPYLVIVVFVVAHIYRYNTDQLNWSAQSSEFLEKKQLRLGSMLFHIGIIFALGGHLMGLLIPAETMVKIGLSDDLYHMLAFGVGGLVGILALIGILLLLMRRMTNVRVRAITTTGEYFMILLLTAVVVAGLYNTLTGSFLHPDYDYRDTISPWFRSLLVFSPDAELMRDVPLGFRVHIFLSFVLLLIWPFTRLVHVWSLPLESLKRSPVLYRKR